jgi:hypothetical protein
MNLIQNLALSSVQRFLASGKRLFSMNGEPLNGRLVSLELSNAQPRFLKSPDPEQERFTDKMSSSDQITSICLLFFWFFPPGA